MPGLLYVDDLVLSGESEEHLRVMIGRFVEICERRGLKVCESKRKVKVLGGEERSIYEVIVDGSQIECILKGFVLDESGTSGVGGKLHWLSNLW